MIKCPICRDDYYGPMALEEHMEKHGLDPEVDEEHYQAGYDEGYDGGYDQGLADGQRRIKKFKEGLDRLTQALIG